jgi:hypothetical protein
MNKKTIYLAGKVTGEPIHQCTMKFGAAQKELEQLGFEVINPLQVVNDWHCPWPQAMKKCLEAMLKADVVYFLPCYRQSRGAKLEEHLAIETQIPRCYNIVQALQIV